MGNVKISKSRNGSLFILFRNTEINSLWVKSGYVG